MGDKDVIAKVARWMGLFAALMTFILGVVHISNRKAKIVWPAGGFADDVNRVRWRTTLFTFDPEIFLDVWSPVFFGLLGTLCHFTSFKIDLITENFIRFFVFHLVLGLFACIGYEGGLGIIFSIFIWLTCLFALIAALVAPGHANLELKLSCSVDDVKRGRVVRV